MIDAGDKPRWGLSLAVVLAVHAAGAAAVLAWVTPAAAPQVPAPAAILIDLAPQPTAASAQAAAEPQSQPPEPEPPPPEPAPVPLPKPPPRPLSTPKKPVPRPQPQPAVQQAVAESVAPAEERTPVAAPSRPTAAEPSPVVPAWHQALLAHLERHRRYPAAARQRRQEGTSQALFSIDRQGRVVTSRLQTSSGHPLLDQETLELLQRAQPLPPPPAEVAGDRVELSVPVRFSLR